MNRHMHPAHAYLRVSEGPDDLLGDQLSLTRRLLTLFVAFVLFSGTSLFAMAAFDIDQALLGKAVAATGKSSSDDDEDNSGPGGGGDDDETDTDDATTAGQESESDDNGDGDRTRAPTRASSASRTTTRTRTRTATVGPTRATASR